MVGVDDSRLVVSNYVFFILPGILFCGHPGHVICSSLHCVSVCGISHDATGEDYF